MPKATLFPMYFLVSADYSVARQYAREAEFTSSLDTAASDEEREKSRQKRKRDIFTDVEDAVQDSSDSNLQVAVNSNSGTVGKASGGTGKAKKARQTADKASKPKGLKLPPAPPANLLVVRPPTEETRVPHDDDTDHGAALSSSNDGSQAGKNSDAGPNSLDNLSHSTPLRSTPSSSSRPATHATGTPLQSGLPHTPLNVSSGSTRQLASALHRSHHGCNCVC